MALAGSYTAMLKKLVTNPSDSKRLAIVYLGVTLAVAIGITVIL